MPSLMPEDADVRVQVIGSAYIDEVVEVRGALCGEGIRTDYSRTESGRTEWLSPGVFLVIESPNGDRIEITDPGRRIGRRILISEPRIVGDTSLPHVSSTVELISAGRQLGGMGPGYALALGGRLVAPVGAHDGGPDATGSKLLNLLEAAGVECACVPVPGSATDTTVLIQSDHGDKLPVGRREAGRRVAADDLLAHCSPADIHIVTSSLPNAVAAELAARLEGWKLFAPSLRSVRDGGLPESAREFDAVAMNGTEWEALAEREQVLSDCPLVLVTRGPEGATVACRAAGGGTEWVSVPAATPPVVRDVNRAGEAFGAGFVGAMVSLVGTDGLNAGSFGPELVREAAWQGAIAAALELGITETAFPTRAEVLALRHSSSEP
jgi:sugar/nucleoside kinase (ribokinase family)